MSWRGTAPRCAACEPVTRDPGPPLTRKHTGRGRLTTHKEVWLMLEAQIRAGDGLAMTRDGRLYATGVPEPEWLLRRYRIAEELRQLQTRREPAGPAGQERPGIVERVRAAFARG